MENRGIATLNANCHNAGLVFGYVDRQNYWVQVYSKAQQKLFVYQVSGGTWTQRSSASQTITAGTQFTMYATVRAGQAGNYAGTCPAGQVGLWCSDSSDNSFDNFEVRDLAGPFEVDGRYFSDRGNVRVDNADNNVLETYGTAYGDDEDEGIVRRGFRGEKYVATFKFKWDTNTRPGWLVRWIDPGNWLAVAVNYSDNKAALYKCVDGHRTTEAPSAGTVSLTVGTWYEAKVVVDNDGLAGQRLRFWVNGNLMLTDTTVIDGTWTAGYVGLFRLAGYSVVHQFDDVTVWLETDGNGILNTGDAVQVCDNFNSNVLSLSYDDNGNLMGDGLYKYVYDAWNRLVKAQRQAAHAGQSDDVTTIGEYKYLPDNRRASKVVSNCGVEQTAADGGNTTVHFYYSNKWQVLETRNGSSQATRQWVYGTGGPDDLVFLDVNGDPGNSNDCNPDVTAQGESGQDRRYVYQQDRNPSVMVLLETDDGAGTAGRAVERYSYTPYGEFVVLKGDAGSGELGSSRLTSGVGNPFTHQGLFFDAETGSFQNRYRQRGATGWYQRDPLGYRAGLNLYGCLGANPVNAIDPAGLMKAIGYGQSQPAPPQGEPGVIPPLAPPPPDCSGWVCAPGSHPVAEWMDGWRCLCELDAGFECPPGFQFNILTGYCDPINPSPIPPVPVRPPPRLPPPPLKCPFWVTGPACFTCGVCLGVSVMAIITTGPAGLAVLIGNSPWISVSCLTACGTCVGCVGRNAGLW